MVKPKKIDPKFARETNMVEPKKIDPKFALVFISVLIIWMLLYVLPMYYAGSATNKLSAELIINSEKLLNMTTGAIVGLLGGKSL